MPARPYSDRERLQRELLGSLRAWRPLLRLAYATDEQLASDEVHALLEGAERGPLWKATMERIYTIGGRPYGDIRVRLRAAREIRDALARGVKRIVEGADDPTVYAPPKRSVCQVRMTNGKICPLPISHGGPHENGSMRGTPPRESPVVQDFVVLGRHPLTGAAHHVNPDTRISIMANDLQDRWYMDLIALSARVRGVLHSPTPWRQQYLLMCQRQECGRVFIADRPQSFCGATCRARVQADQKHRARLSARNATT